MNARDIDNRACANVRCGKAIDGREFVLQVSTAHMRWFCNIECAIEGKEAVERMIAESVFKEVQP